jgi:hypothetical protein
MVVLGENMSKKLLLTAASIMLPIGLIGFAGAGSAFAKGKPVPVSATGPTTCNFNGSLQVTDASNLGLISNFTPYKHTPACNNTGGASSLHTGHLRSAASADTWTDLCVLLTGTQPSDLSNASMSWSPRSKVADSTGVSLTSGSITQVLGSDGNTYLQLSYSGAVTAGSFTGGFSVTATSTSDLTSLQSDCSAGPVTGIHFRGSINLG